MWTSLLTALSEGRLLQYTVPITGIELGQTAVTAIGMSLILLLLVGSGFFLVGDCVVLSPKPPD